VSATAQRLVAALLLVIGIAIIVVTFTVDLNGGPSWLHFITWIGGGLTAYGLVSLLTAGRGANRTRS